MATNKKISPHEVHICLEGMCNEQLNLLHEQIGTLTFPQWFQQEPCEVGMVG